MSTLPIQSTIYFDPDVHDALQAKAAMTQHTISDVVNEVMRIAMKESRGDLKPFIKKQRNSIKTAPGCGIWKEREDMKDPTDYIQKIRNVRRFL